MRRTWVVAIVAALALLAVLFGHTPPAGAAQQFEVVERRTVAPGIEQLRIERHGPPLVVHVTSVTGEAPASVSPVLSNDGVSDRGPSGGYETTSSMCRRARAAVCINGDFSSGPGNSQPFGGLVVGSRLLRTPRADHEQVSFLDTGPSTARWAWSAVVQATYGPPVGGDSSTVAGIFGSERTLRIDGVNVPRLSDQLVLYTPEFARSTQTQGAGTEAVVRTAAPLRLGQPVDVELVEVRTEVADTPIPDGGLVLSASGKAADSLEEFWREYRESDDRARRATVLLQTDLAVRHSLGGHPVVLSDGERRPLDPNDRVLFQRHPRTLLGWDGSGGMWFVTIDGRAPGYSVGATIPEAAELLLFLGATDAINLDGGGSTTMVARGACGEPGALCVVNRPSDGRERPITTALALVVRDVAAATAQVAAPDEAPAAPAAAPAAAPPTAAPPASAPAAAPTTPPPPAPVAAADAAEPSVVPAAPSPAGGPTAAGPYPSGMDARASGPASPAQVPVWMATLAAFAAAAAGAGSELVRRSTTGKEALAAGAPSRPQASQSTRSGPRRR